MKELKEILLAWAKTNPKEAIGTFLMILAPGIGFAGAGTTEFIDSLRAGVSWGSSNAAFEQKKLWEKNAGCFSPERIHKLKNQHNVEVGTLICDNGDVLISTQSPDDKYPNFTWIDLAKFSDPVSMNFDVSLFSKAYAQTQMLGVRRNPDGTCTYVYINPYTGRPYEVIGACP
jgi:hypothetical protein